MTRFRIQIWREWTWRSRHFEITKVQEYPANWKAVRVGPIVFVVPFPA